MNISGKKMGSVKALKESLKKGGSSLTTFIKNVPAEGITVRFITEPEEWFGYYEYWNDETRNFCPMAVGEVLPDGAKPSFRYLTCAVDVESDRVIPLKLAKTAANSLILKYDKFGTMVDRNYELQRHGEGLDTTYDVTPEGPSKLNLGKYEVIDLEKVLLDARASALGEKDATPRKTEASFDDDDVDSDDDSEDAYARLFPDDGFREDYSESDLKEIENNFPDELAELLDDWGLDSELEGKPAINAILKAQKDADDDADADSDEDEDSDEDTDSDSYDEETLKAMSLRDLRLIAEDLGVEITGLSKDALIEAVIESTEE